MDDVIEVTEDNVTLLDLWRISIALSLRLERLEIAAANCISLLTARETHEEIDPEHLAGIRQSLGDFVREVTVELRRNHEVHLQEVFLHSPE